MVEAYSDLTKKVGALNPSAPIIVRLFPRQAGRWAWRNARRSLPSRSQSEKRSM